MVKVEISTDIESDIREDLFYALADKRIPLMSLSFERKTLEDIFIELTSDSFAKEDLDTEGDVDKKIMSDKNVVTETDNQEDADNDSNL